MKIKMAVLLVALMSMAACDKSPNVSAQGTDAKAERGAAAPKAAFQAKKIQDKDTYFVFAKNQTYTDRQLVQEFDRFNKIFWAATEKNEGQIAIDLIPKFKGLSDEFRKSDLIKEHKALLDAFYDEAKAVGAKMAVFTGPVIIKKYDAQKQGFEFNFTEPSLVSLGNSRVPFMVVTAAGVPSYYTPSKPVPDLYVYKPKAEADARRIESALASVRGGSSEASVNMIVYGRVVKTVFQPDRREVFMLPDHIEVVAQKNRNSDAYEVLWDIDAATLQAMWKLHGDTTYAPGPDDVVEMLGLKPISFSRFGSRPM